MDSLKKTSIRALLWDLLGTLGQQGISFVVSIFLARILAPTDFGLVGMALVFISIFQVFADFGFAAALIQNKDNTNLIYSSVFFINIGVGFLLCLLFQGLAPWIGEFYNNSEVSQLIRWLSLTFVLTAFNIVQATILRRNLNFKTLSLLSVATGFVSGALGILLAINGYGVYALVAQQLTASFLSTILLWSTSNWYPSWVFSWKVVRALTNFSTYIFFSQLLNTLLSRLDVLVVGKVFSPATLGYYTRAESLNHLVVRYSSEGITKVFFPVLSQLQDQPERFKAVFLKTISVVAFLTFLLSGIFILSGEFIILTLFGEKWQPSVFIFQILMFKMFNYPINSMLVNSFLALGKAKENFWYGMVRKLLQLVPFVVVFFVDFNSFLYTLVLVSLIATIFNNIISSLHNNIPFIEQTQAIYTYALFFTVALIIDYLIAVFINNSLLLIIRITIFTTVYLLLSFLFKKEDLIIIADVLPERLFKKVR